jgi:hypothetical protein
MYSESEFHILLSFLFLFLVVFSSCDTSTKAEVS